MAVDYKYQGNDDFRGWIAGGSANKYLADWYKNTSPTGQSQYVSSLLKNVGNDGKSGNAGWNVVSTRLYDQYNKDKELYKSDQAYNQQLALINAMKTPTPRFVNYDITGSWNKAREMATQAVSPIYQQKMNDFINRQQQELGRKQTDTNTGKYALDQALARLMEDTGVQRNRTAEDTAFNIQDINDNLAYTTRAESLNYDAANRALTEGLGAGNMAESGLGQQQLQEGQLARREQSNEVIRQSDNKVEAQNTLMNRTFEDLTTKETRSGEDTTSGKQKLDLDLERFIEDQAYDRDQTQKQNDLSMAADIAQKSIGIQGQLVDQWIASLSGKGYTAQEIANAASIYK